MSSFLGLILQSIVLQAYSAPCTWWCSWSLIIPTAGMRIWQISQVMSIQIFKDTPLTQSNTRVVPLCVLPLLRAFEQSIIIIQVHMTCPGAKSFNIAVLLDQRLIDRLYLKRSLAMQRFRIMLLNLKDPFCSYATQMSFSTRNRMRPPWQKPDYSSTVEVLKQRTLFTEQRCVDYWTILNVYLVMTMKSISQEVNFSYCWLRYVKLQPIIRSFANWRVKTI